MDVLLFGAIYTFSLEHYSKYLLSFLWVSSLFPVVYVDIVFRITNTTV